MTTSSENYICCRLWLSMMPWGWQNWYKINVTLPGRHHRGFLLFSTLHFHRLLMFIVLHHCLLNGSHRQRWQPIAIVIPSLLQVINATLLNVGKGGYCFAGGRSTTGGWGHRYWWLCRRHVAVRGSIYFILCTDGTHCTINVEARRINQWPGNSHTNRQALLQIISFNLASQRTWNWWWNLSCTGPSPSATGGGEYSAVPLKVGRTIFTVDLILLPIYGVDCVLRVQWLL